ncbi:MAG: hypothetical protein IPK18_03380 [Sphingobacteriales bacterium]|nr:MAG: hypothetical protein IPK18_03380 [Sphingobacteriales bacterium]
MTKDSNIVESDKSVYDFKVVFDKLNEVIATQSSELKEDLRISNETVSTIAYFRDFQNSQLENPISFYTKS